ERLEDARVTDSAAETQRRHGLARDLAHGFEIRYGARLVEPKRVRTLDSLRYRSRIAGGQRSLSGEHEIAILGYFLDQLLHLVLISFALVTRSGFRRCDGNGAEGRLVRICKG